MKLYYFPGACSLAVHIVLEEIGLPYEMIRVDLAKKTTENSKNYFEINPKGFVPALELDNGQVLTEAQVIVQYLADQNPDSYLIPPMGSIARYRVMEWLSYIAMEVQKGFGPLFNPNTSEETRKTVISNLINYFDFISESLGDKDYLCGDRYTIVDAYLFTILNWTRFVEVDLTPWKKLRRYMARIMKRPAVKQAMTSEKMI